MVKLEEKQRSNILNKNCWMYNTDVCRYFSILVGVYTQASFVEAYITQMFDDIDSTTVVNSLHGNWYEFSVAKLLLIPVLFINEFVLAIVVRRVDRDLVVLFDGNSHEPNQDRFGRLCNSLCQHHLIRCNYKSSVARVPLWDHGDCGPWTCAIAGFTCAFFNQESDQFVDNIFGGVWEERRIISLVIGYDYMPDHFASIARQYIVSVMGGIPIVVRATFDNNYLLKIEDED
jgi:hypothetical protein